MVDEFSDNIKPNFDLCYITIVDLFLFLKKNNRNILKNEEEKKKWKEMVCSSSFFSKTIFFLLCKDVLLIEVEEEIEQKMLFLTYEFAFQDVCVLLWKEEKNIVVLTTKQREELESKTKEKTQNTRIPVLLSNQEKLNKNFDNSFNKN